MIISKKIKIDYAHLLKNKTHNNLCHNFHGHTAIVEFIFEGEKDAISGMVVDFGVLKSLLNNTVVRYLEHGIAVNKNDDPEIINIVKKRNIEKVVMLDGEPTAENLAEWAYNLMENELDLPFVKLKKVIWHETENNKAEYER